MSDSTMKGQAMWGGRFTKRPDHLVELFNASVLFDARLALHDIKGSIAHATMLAKVGVLTEEEASIIVDGLAIVRAEIEDGKFVWQTSLEDVHMNIEHRLTALIGPVGGKLHTARSRNDQVALDMHLYVREELDMLDELLTEWMSTLLDVARRYDQVIIPGYTHLQRAQPVLLAHHLLAYFWMFSRDRERVRDARKRVDWSPLGAGALAGTTFPIDREDVAKQLDFHQLYENSMDAVSDRDYIVETLSIMAMIMMHLSRLSEELILFTSYEFGFIELDDAYTTGSSIMPQKKNPDIAELVRGKTGRVYGHLLGLLTTVKGLPLAYNKDLQEDKEGLFDAFDTVKPALVIFKAMIATMTVKTDVIEKAMRHDFSAATDLADYLAKKGLPFRQAHEVVGKIVRTCLDRQIALIDIDLATLKEHSEYFEQDALTCLFPRSVVGARNSRGGTSPVAVAQQIQYATAMLQD